ncbi:MAG TPA: aromatic ring-hydroxylating dioxygenase subunit alpha [Steroidobacteraceae bacterium]|nr:aromatic ring-hydroxylating dioxygenase subunit alpha [Steroidobacteraceae bacterium]
MAAESDETTADAAAIRSDERLEALIRSHRAGHALAREFYTDPAIFELDMERMLLKHWFCAGHASSIAKSGDYLTVDLGAESVILVRTAAGEVRALLNVCRHRGSRLVSERRGRAAAGRLTCPYHAWSYDLDGNLLIARQMAESFQRGAHGLRTLPVRVVEGLIFTTFAERPLDFAPAEEALVQSAGVYGWGRAKIAHRELYSIEANWKLAVENYMECYHCQPAHPEFSKRHVYARPAEMNEEIERAARRRAESLGIFVPDIDRYGCAAGAGRESSAVLRSALSEGFSSATADGRASRRLMGSFCASDGNSCYFDVGPLSDFLAYPDHGVIYRFIPRAVDRTEMEVLWLVDEAAVEGEDYDIERLTWLWRTTSAEDKRIVEMNQAGVNSRFFEPGPYSMQESYAERFVSWYLSELADR